MKTIIAVIDKKGENAPAMVIAALRGLSPTATSDFAIALPSAPFMDKNPSEFHIKKLKSRTALGYSSTNGHVFEPKIMKLVDATLVFHGRVYSPPPTASLLNGNACEKPLSSDQASNWLLKKVEGDYSFAILEPERIVAGRDPVGVEPIYFGENSHVVALASYRKALWKLGVEKTLSFPPGHLAYVRREGFEFKPVKTLNYVKPKTTTMQKGAVELQKLLQWSIARRVSDLKKVAVAFSGGIDSSIIAAMAKTCGVDTHLIHVSLENRSETEAAKSAATELKLPLHIYLYRESDVAAILPKVVELIEEPDPVKASVGVSFYWCAEKAAQAGFEVLLAGQGADELFGGYQRYINDYVLHGEETTRKIMYGDVTKLHESNIERDVKICSSHDVELRLPFASFQIAKFATTLPIELKIEKKSDSLRKLVLRKVAQNIGLSEAITQKTKKAVQYSTGINDAIKKSAQKQKMTMNEYVEKLFQNIRNKEIEPKQK
jgi:asparagine synthase (glutamine-hydrolysing)